MMKTAVRVNRTAHHTPDATEVSGIMWHVGFMSDAMGQAGAVLVMAVGVIYLFTYIKQLKTA